MPKYRLNEYHNDYMSNEIAKIIESENGYIERKKNGSIWVKQPNNKGIYALTHMEKVVDDLVQKNWDNFTRHPDMNLQLFDHIAYYTTVDGEPFALYRPYSLGDWIEIIPELFQKGIVMKPYKNLYPLYYAIIMRKRRDDDKEPNVDDFRYWDSIVDESDCF